MGRALVAGTLRASTIEQIMSSPRSKQKQQKKRKTHCHQHKKELHARSRASREGGLRSEEVPPGMTTMSCVHNLDIGHCIGK